MEVPLGKAKVSIVAETNKLEKDLKNVKGKIKGVGVETEKTAKKSNRAWKSTTVNVKDLREAFFSLQGAMSALSVGVVSQQLWEAGTAVERLSESFKAIEGNSLKSAKEIKFLRDTAEELGLEFWEIAGAYKGMLAASKGTTFEGEQIRFIFKSMSEAGVALRMSNEDVKGSLRALEQMMSKGTVQAEELRGQLGERLPGAFKLAADSMGVTTMELGKMLEMGQVLATDLLPALADSLHEKYGVAASEASESATASMSRFKTEFMDLKVELANSGFMDAAISGLEDITAGLNNISNWVANNGKSIDNFFKGLAILEAPLVALYKYNKSMLGIVFSANELESIYSKDVEHLGQMTAHASKMLGFSEKRARKEKELFEAQKKAQIELNNISDSFNDDDKFERDIKAGYDQLLDIEEFEDSIEEAFEGMDESTESFFKGVAENFTTAIQSEMSGVFTDLLTGDLDNFEDYFSNFTASLTQMWGAMAAKMFMTQSMWSAGNFAALGGAGIALAGISSVLDKRSQERAEEKARRESRARIEKQVTGSIAQLELSDLNYEIFQMNNSFQDLVAAAAKAKAPMEDIVKLRGLEIEAIIKQSQAGFSNLSGDISDFITGKQRQEWSVADWQREFGVLSDELMSLDKTQDTYNNESLELLTDQFEILQNIYNIQENQLRALESTSQSLVAQVVGLQTSEGMPISREFFESEYQRLLLAAETVDSETGMLNITDIAFFQGFVNDYIDTMSTLGDDHQGLINKTSSDLLSINDAVQSEMEMLTAALSMNTDAVGENTDAIKIVKQLEDLGTTITDAFDDAGFSTWLATAPKSEDIVAAGGYSGYGQDFDPTYDFAKKADDVFGLSNQDYADYVTNWSGWLSNSQRPGAAELYENWITSGLNQDVLTNEQADSWLGWLGKTPGIEAGKYVDISSAYNDWFNEKPEDFPEGFEHGGLATKLGVIGEGGEPEWAVPAHNNSNNAGFLKSVGMDRVIEAIEKRMGNNGGSSSNNTEVLQPINLVVSEKMLSSVMVNLSRTNPEFAQMLRQ